MHEMSVVQHLIEALDRELARQGVRRALQVRVRRGSAFSSQALEQAFALYTPGTRLEGAALEVETVETRITCTRCGHSEVVSAEDVVNHMVLCPACGALQLVDDAHELALVDVTVEAS